MINRAFLIIVFFAGSNLFPSSSHGQVKELKQILGQLNTTPCDKYLTVTFPSLVRVSNRESNQQIFNNRIFNTFKKDWLNGRCSKKGLKKSPIFISHYIYYSELSNVMNREEDIIVKMISDLSDEKFLKVINLSWMVLTNRRDLKLFKTVKERVFKLGEKGDTLALHLNKLFID
jgi:hypothetical protein